MTGLSLTTVRWRPPKKLWIKDLPDFPAQAQPFATYYWLEKETDKKGSVIRETKHSIPGYDTRGDALVKAFGAIYPKLHEGFKTYFSREEMTQVRLDAEKVRKLKRY